MTAPVGHGYPDWGRFAAQADTVWVNDLGNTISADHSYGPFHTSPYAYMRVSFQSAVNHFDIAVRFYEDNPPSITLGAHQLVVRQGQSLDTVLPVMGPWCVFTVTPSAPASSYSLVVHSVSGPAIPLGNSASRNILISRINESVPAATTEDWDSNVVWPGEAHWYAENPAGVVETRLVAVNSAGTETAIDRLIGSGANDHRTVFLPPMPVRVKFINTTAGALVFHSILVARPLWPGS